MSPLTGAAVDAPGRLEADSWAGLHFLDAPWCALCGFPFPYPAGDGAVCGACAARQPRYDLARAAFVYDEASRALILGFKHGGRVDALAQFARWMARSGAEALDGADALVPVPLHPVRLFRRRFNQSALLAQALAKQTGLPVETDALRRARPTPSQAGLNARARRRNMAGAFTVREPAKPRVKDASLVLVDDVFTTGATLQACARALKRAGARRVAALTLARVVRPVNPLT